MLNPFPVLASERLVLRQLAMQDAAAMFSLRSDDRVNRYIGRPKQTKIAEAEAFIHEITQNRLLYWAICTKDSTDLIGTICLWNFSEDKTSAEAGYELLPDFQGQGFMDEALKRIIAYSFEEISLQALCAFTHPENEASKRLLERNGFKPAADQKEAAAENLTKYILGAGSLVCIG